METFDDNLTNDNSVAIVVPGSKLVDGGEKLIGDGEKLIEPLLCADNQQDEVGYNNPATNLSIEKECDGKILASGEDSVERIKLLGVAGGNDEVVERIKLLAEDGADDKPAPPPPYEDAGEPLPNARKQQQQSGCHTRRSNTCENCGQVVRNCDVGATSSKTSTGEASMSKASSGVSISTCSLQVDFCRICHCEADSEMGRLIAPCKCKGTLRNVHQACLQQWIKSSDCKHCELCGFHFAMNTKLKPISKWEKLSMSTSERRKIMCSVIFHLVAITCVVWSLYVLIERTADELQNRKLQWPFWTKLVVVAIGFAGGLVFMYVQCKIYVQLWRRLKAFNRIIYVQHQPSSPSIDEEAGRGASHDMDEVVVVGSKTGNVETASSYNGRHEEVVLVEVTQQQQQS